MRIYSAVKTGKSHMDSKRVCDDRILIGRQLVSEGYFETELNELPLVVAVADGVGGTHCGWKAAEVALECIAAWTLSAECTEDELKALFEMVNKQVIQAAYEPEWAGTASTLTVLVLDEDAAKVLHVGDSRAYQKRKVQGCSFFRQITEDQDLLHRWLREEEGVTPSDLKCRRGWNRIWGFVGMPPEGFCDVCSMERVVADGVFVLTTDGIHDYLEKREFEELLGREGSWKEKLEMIMQRAEENGSRDDQSIIVVEYE